MLDLLIPFLRALSVGFAALFALLSVAAMKAIEKTGLSDEVKAWVTGFLLFFNVGFIVSCAGLYATWGL